MKKRYMTPVAERNEFDYSVVVVASNGTKGHPFSAQLVEEDDPVEVIEQYEEIRQLEQENEIVAPPIVEEEAAAAVDIAEDIPEM